MIILTLLTVIALIFSTLLNILFVFGFKIAVVVGAFFLVNKIITDHNKKKFGGDPECFR